MRNKYGNIQVPIPKAFYQEKESVNKALAEKMITPEEARQRTLAIQHRANLFIVMTNGGYSVPTRHRRAKARRLMRVRRYLKQMQDSLVDPASSDAPHSVQADPTMMEELQSRVDSALEGGDTAESE